MTTTMMTTSKRQLGRGGQILAPVSAFGGEKQRKKHRRLRHRHERCHRAQIAGKDHRREKVQNRLAQKHRRVSRHARVKAAVNARAARAEEHDGRHQKREVFLARKAVLVVPVSLAEELADGLFHQFAAAADPLAQMTRKAERRARHDGQNHRGHVLHQRH